MKKKLMIFALTSVVFCLGIILSLYILISNYEYEQKTRDQLVINNRVIGTLLQSSYTDIEKGKLTPLSNSANPEYRLTLIDKTGKVIFDSVADKSTMENHNSRVEVIEARKNGVGSSIRFSNTIKKKMIYVASQINDGYIIRSSVALQYINLVDSRYVKYYIIAILLVLALTAMISSRLSVVIIKPIKDLEDVTERIAQGELETRVSINSRDEVGHLGKTFNKMADRLQSTFKDSIEKQNKLEAILKSMDSGVVAVDKNNKIMMINPYAKKIFGITKDIIGKNLIDYIRDFEFEKILHADTDNYTEMKILWPSERILRVRTADIVNESENIGKVAVVQDITEVKKLENMRTDFVANVSHELKTPLTSIKGFAETLRFVEDEEKKEKFLNIINDEAERLTRLINDILILSDLENHKEEKREQVDINEAITQVCNMIKPTADSKGIEVVTELGEADCIVGSVDRFKQMIINLVDNALKYSDAGARVEVGTGMNDKECIVWVKDNGVGIPKEHIPRLFERFYRVDKARSRAKGGTGLGLAIVKHIVLSLNGTIEIESEIGKGSKFTIHIPKETQF